MKATKDKKGKKSLTLKNLTKGNVWDLQENDIIRLLEQGEKDPEFKDYQRRYFDIIRSAFLIEKLDAGVSIKKQYESKGYKTMPLKGDDDQSLVFAIKKRSIQRITDLTYENIHHITATKLLEIIDHNFGGGWDGISQSIKDVIESAFDISTTTLPKDRLHKKSSMYGEKIADGFEVLEIAKGNWTEAIFAKAKPDAESPQVPLDRRKYGDTSDGDGVNNSFQSVLDEDEEEMTEDNYRTTFNILPDSYDGDVSQAEQISDESYGE